MKWIETTPLQNLLRRVWVALRDPQRWRQAFTRNLSLKLLSLLIAFGLWSFVNFGERDTEDTLKVPLELRNIPPQLMITSPRNDFVDLRVVGPRTLLGRIDRNRLALPLDLSGVKPGPAVFRVGAEALALPRGVRVVRINPAQVTIELERISHKTVPVRLRLVGKPATDLQVTDTKVSPEMVQVSGPASDIENISIVPTQAIDISKLSAGTIERELPLETVGDYVSFSASRVAVQVRIEEIAMTREFKRVGIEIRGGAPGMKTNPETLRVVIRGPKRIVSSLELGGQGAYVDLSDAVSGDPKPVIELPEGVEIVAMEPETVKLLTPAKRLRRAGR
jgi:YbbR domain-containing protein